MNLHKSFSNTRQIFYMVASESELRARFLTKIAKNEITFHKKKMQTKCNQPFGSNSILFEIFIFNRQVPEALE